jgi:IMP dehydrogenase
MHISKPAYTFDDLVLKPRYSEKKSRFSDEIDLSNTVLSYPELRLRYPLISANMDTVTGWVMAKSINELGGLGIIHRFMPKERHLEEINKTCFPRILCLGVDTESRERLDYFLEHEACLAGILIDIAHGHCKAMGEMIKYVKGKTSLPIMAGNVATSEGAEFLVEYGVSSIKVGIGNGALCTTRIKTGNGVPQATAIMEVAAVIDQVNTPISLISDGGIRHSGDIVKALALGADACMIGNLFAGCNEAPGDVVYYPTPCKRYRGMASREAQLSWKGSYSSVEGEEMWVSLKGPVQEVFMDLVAGIRSGLSYQGASNIHQLETSACFYIQTHAGYIEGTPHGKSR